MSIARLRGLRAWGALGTAIAIVSVACSSNTVGGGGGPTEDAGPSSAEGGGSQSTTTAPRVKCTKKSETCECTGGPTEITTDDLLYGKMYTGDQCRDEGLFHDGQDVYCCASDPKWPDVAGTCACFGRKVWGCETDFATGSSCTCGWHDWGWDTDNPRAVEECSLKEPSGNKRCCRKTDGCFCDDFPPGCDSDEGTGAPTCGSYVAPGVSKKPTGVTTPKATCKTGFSEVSFCSTDI